MTPPLVLHPGSRAGVPIIGLATDRMIENFMTNEVQSDAHRPSISSAQGLSLIPIINQLEIGCRLYTLCVKPARCEVVNIHLNARARVFPTGCRLVLYHPRPGNLGVPQRSTRSHKERVIHVPCIGEHDEIETEQPGFFAAENVEIRRMEGRVGKRLVHDGGHVVLEVVKDGGLEVGVCCWGTLSSVSFQRCTGQEMQTNHETEHRILPPSTPSSPF
jgi:hypothetical protein